MRRQKWIINVMLLALAVTLVVKLRGDWMRANQRYGTINPAKKPATAAAPNVSVLGAVAANPAANQMIDSIVQNNLFAPDRNNNVPPLPQKHEAPAEPILLGVMDIGGGPLALMAEGDRPGPARQVKIGEEIGGYKLVKVTGDFAMVEWEGEQKRLEVQFAPRPIAGPARAQTQAQEQRGAQPVAVGPGTPMPANVVNAKVEKPNSTGDKNTRTSYDMFGPGVQDNFPTGTVRDGWQKMERPWPFGGKQVWWERVQK